MTRLQIILLASTALCMMIELGLWFRAKFVLRVRGYPTSLLSFYSDDIDHLLELVESETDPIQRARFQRLHSSIIAFLLLPFLPSGVLFISFLIGIYSR